MIQLANWLARRIKGPDYALDPAITATVVSGFLGRRLWSALRGLWVRTWLKTGSSWLLFVGRDVEVRNGGYIRLGRAVTLGRGVVLDGLSRQGLTLGSNVTLGPYTIIETSGVISSIGEGCSIGAGSGLGSFSFIGAAGGVTIGDNVIMGNRVSFHSENHNFESPEVDIKFQGVTRKGIVVERNCWVGANVTFLDGAHVEEGCVIAAGSVVMGHIPRDSIVAGIPAQVKRSRLKPKAST